LGWYVRLPLEVLIVGVRSHEAKKIMKEKMKLGDKVRLSESGI
jgi:predicted RNA-binding protein with PUA-like domain